MREVFQKAAGHFKRVRWSRFLPILALFSLSAHPAYACGFSTEGVVALGGIVIGSLFLPLILGGLLVAACDRIKFSGYGFLMGLGTFAMTAPVCVKVALNLPEGLDFGQGLLLMMAPGMLSTLHMLVMSLKETKAAERVQQEI